jgi:hypothetical protein
MGTRTRHTHDQNGDNFSSYIQLAYQPERFYMEHNQDWCLSHLQKINCFISHHCINERDKQLMMMLINAHDPTVSSDNSTLTLISYAFLCWFQCTIQYCVLLRLITTIKAMRVVLESQSWRYPEISFTIHSGTRVDYLRYRRKNQNCWTLLYCLFLFRSLPQNKTNLLVTRRTLPPPPPSSNGEACQFHRRPIDVFFAREQVSRTATPVHVYPPPPEGT